MFAGIGYPRVLVNFKNICGYFLSGYPTNKLTGNRRIFFFSNRITDKHYPYPT